MYKTRYICLYLVLLIHSTPFVLNQVVLFIQNVCLRCRNCKCFCFFSFRVLLHVLLLVRVPSGPCVSCRGMDERHHPVRGIRGFCVSLGSTRWVGWPDVRPPRPDPPRLPDHVSGTHWSVPWRATGLTRVTDGGSSQPGDSPPHCLSYSTLLVDCWGSNCKCTSPRVRSLSFVFTKLVTTVSYVTIRRRVWSVWGHTTLPFFN